MSIKALTNIINKYNILYAEDDPSVAAKSKKLFEELFKKVDLVSDGVEALEQYKHYYNTTGKYYDIVISDIKMPNMYGIELFKKIRKINDKQAILALSAHNESEMLQNLINVGITYFIHKPINLEELIKIVLQISNELKKNHESNEQINEVIKSNDEFEALFSGYDKIMIGSRTDPDGIITYVSKGFVSISGYSQEELLGISHSIVRHPDMPDKAFKHMWETITQGKVWKGKVKNLKKNGDYYWTKTSVAPYFDKEGKILGYNSVREDITNQVKLRELHKKINTLLDHANDGYLLIDKELNVQQGYSKICLEIFDKLDIEGCNITQLLFLDDTKNKELLEKGMLKIFNSSNQFKNKLFLSLLPPNAKVNGKSLEINYKIVDKCIMVIVKDITEKVTLESKLEEEQKYQSMVIQVVTNLNDFLELKSDFEKFYQQFYLNGKLINYEFEKGIKSQKLLRELHTFKGLFHQLQMCYTTDAINYFEEYVTKLINKDKISEELLKDTDIKASFQKDLQIIENILGKDYILEHINSNRNKSAIKKIKYHLRNLINDPVNISFKLQDIICEIDLLSYINVEEMINKHVSLVDHLSTLMDKEIYPLEIKKEENLKVPPAFKNFFRNLVHIYKNSIDHGIEDEETRVVMDKDPIGKISCHYYYSKDSFHLTIKDDGRGVDIESLSKKSLEKGITSLKELNTMTDEDKLQLIFYDQLSTKNSTNQISGRGVGMSSVKQSCEDLGGKIELKNYPGKGLEYNFVIPLENLLDACQSDKSLKDLLSLLEAVSNRIKSFFKQELSIDVINTRFVDTIDLTDKVNTQISFETGEENIHFILSCTEKIVKRYAKRYFDEVYEEEDFNETIDGYSKEMINTLIGLAIQDFPPKYIDGILGTPFNLQKDQLQIEKNYSNAKTLILVIQTNYGNIVCKLIHEH